MSYAPGHSPSAIRRSIPVACLLAAWLVCTSFAWAELRIRDICRIKGAEENTLHGLGLLVGLQGTGDGDAPTTRALSKMMELMGSPVAKDANGQFNVDELKNARNVALVYVTANVPSEGARQGEQLNCTANAIGAKSLDGGFLTLTPLLGPRPGDPRIYGFAQGPVTIEGNGPSTAGRIHGGCRLETDINCTFVNDGLITLVLDKSHASFHTAYDIQDTLNSPQTFGTFTSTAGPAGLPQRLGGDDDVAREAIAKAIDQVNIVVRIPPAYTDSPVQFVYEVLETRIFTPQNDARVVINERSGVIVIGDNVEIGSVAVTHKNLSIQAGTTADGPLRVLEQSIEPSTTKLQALVDALNALKVDTQDIIDIIKELERSGDLFGHLVIE